MHVHTLRCFGATPTSGNVALVIEDGPPDVAARQAFAAARGQSACVFLTPTAQQHQVQADFYYPHARSPLCLHATLAAARVLCERGPATLVTAMREQLLPLSHG